MELKKLSDLRKLIEGKPIKKLVLAAAHDIQSLGAVLRASSEKIIEPILIGNKDLIDKIAAESDYDLKGISIIDEKDNIKAINLAVQMVSRGEADVLMKGNVGTSDLLKSVLNKEWGLRRGNLLSHFALFEVDN